MKHNRNKENTGALGVKRDRTGLVARHFDEFRGLRETIRGVTDLYYDQLDLDIRRLLGEPDSSGIFHPDLGAASSALLGHAARLNLPRRLENVIQAYANSGLAATGITLASHIGPLLADLGQLNVSSDFELVQRILQDSLSDAQESFKEVLPQLEQRLHIKDGVLQAVFVKEPAPQDKPEVAAMEDAELDKAQPAKVSIGSVMEKVSAGLNEVVSEEFRDQFFAESAEAQHNHQAAQKTVKAIVNVLHRLDSIMHIALNGVEKAPDSAISAPVLNSKLVMGVNALKAIVSEVEKIQADVQALDLDTLKMEVVQNMHSLGGDAVENVGHLLLHVLKTIDTFETEFGWRSDTEVRKVMDAVKPLVDVHLKYARHFDQVSLISWSDFDREVKAARAERLAETAIEKQALIADIDALKNLRQDIESLRHFSDFKVWPKGHVRAVASLYGDHSLIDLKHAADYLKTMGSDLSQILKTGDSYLLHQAMTNHIQYLDPSQASITDLIQSMAFNNLLASRFAGLAMPSEEAYADHMPQAGYTTGVLNSVFDVWGYGQKEYPSASLSRVLVNQLDGVILQRQREINHLDITTSTMARKQTEVLYENLARDPEVEDLKESQELASLMASIEAEHASDPEAASTSDKTAGNYFFEYVGELFVAVLSVMWNVIKYPFVKLSEVGKGTPQASKAEAPIEDQPAVAGGQPAAMGSYADILSEVSAAPKVAGQPEQVAVVASDLPSETVEPSQVDVTRVQQASETVSIGEMNFTFLAHPSSRSTDESVRNSSGPRSVMAAGPTTS